MKLVGHKYLVCHSFWLASYILLGYCFGTRMSPVDAERTRPQRINLKTKALQCVEILIYKAAMARWHKTKIESVFAFVFSFLHSLGILLSKVPSETLVPSFGPRWGMCVYDLRANTVSVRNARSGGRGHIVGDKWIFAITNKLYTVSVGNWVVFCL